MEIKQANRVVDGSAANRVVARLLGRQDVPLSAWYGDPLSRFMAKAFAARARDELRSCLCEGANCFQLHVLLLICNSWSGTGIQLDYKQLAASTRLTRERALLELVYAQLLFSTKCRKASQHFAEGFSLAVGFLGTSDYFCLVRQRELLEFLPLSSQPSAPLDLEALLAEAGVIRRLQAGTGRRYGSTHHDTVG